MAAKLLLSVAVVLCALLTNAFSQIYTSVKFQYATVAYPGAVSTNANGINDGNVIVGSYFDRNFSVHGFVYRNGKYARLDFPGSTETEVLGISNTGDIVGVYQTSGPLNFHSFLWHEHQFTTLDDPAAQFGTRAFGISNNGTVVGSIDDSQGFILKAGEFRTFNAPQRRGDTLQTQLNGISNSGWMVGQVLSGGNWRGFWRNGDDLDFLEPQFANDNEVTGINAGGDIVGCHDANSGFVAFRVELTEHSETGESFPHQQPLVSCASAINDFRVVVGNYFRVGQPNGFLAVPQLTLNVVGPKNHSSVTSPVHLLAGAIGVNPIWQIQVWANTRKLFVVESHKLNADVQLPKGTNERVIVRAVDIKGTSTNVVMMLTVN